MKMNFLKKIIVGCIFTILVMSSPSQSQQSDAGQKRIDLDILNMDVESVLKIISDTSGWTIIPSQKIRGKVSLWSKGATARELLDKLVLVNNYIYKQQENVIYLMTKDEFEQRFGKTTKIFCLKYQKAENIKQLLANSLTKTGKLGIDSWSNSIVINDTSENLKKIESLIADLDQGFVQKRFQLVNAKAAEVAKILKNMCPKEGPFQADTRTNSIIVFNSKSNVSRIAELIIQLDQDVVTRVFQIKYQKASELASQLSSFLNGSQDTKKSDKFDGIIVSDTTNQIVVTASVSKMTYIANLLEQLDSKVITVTIPLRHLKASQILPQISNLASKPENITADSQGNQLIICDNTHNIEQIRNVVQALDKSLVTRVFTLNYALAEDIEKVLRALVTDPQTLQAEPRTNQIIICDSEHQLARIENIIKKLDCEDAYFTRTYHLEHASASHVADIIKSFISQNSQGTHKEFGRIENSEINNKPNNKIISDPSFSFPHFGPEPHRNGEVLGFAPGLAAAGYSKQTSVTSPLANSSLSPTPPGRGAAFEFGTNQTVTNSLGTAGTVVADDRTNTITITETLAVLTKAEQLIADIDTPIHSYSYIVKHRQLNSLNLDTEFPKLLRLEVDTFSIDDQTHIIHFTTIPSIAQRLLKMLEDWDKPAKQALIRAKIIAISTSTLKDIGINFDSLFDISNVKVAIKSSLPSQVGSDHAGSLSIRKLTGTQYEAIIRAIENDNHSRILASPRILVLDGKSAEVRMATDEPFTETSLDAQNGRTLENIRFLQVGTVLRVKPIFNEDNSIEMEIGLDVSSLTEIRNGTPVVNHNIANSTVTIKDGHILMMGGLKFNRNIKVNEKIPFLADLPIIGGLFRSTRNEVAESELILLLQPNIINASDNISESELSEKLQTATKPELNGHKRNSLE